MLKRALSMIAMVTIASGASALVTDAAYAQSLKEQAQCAALARQTFQEDENKWHLNLDQLPPNQRFTQESADYRSHYNPPKQRCFILITRDFLFNGDPGMSETLYDAVEMRTYAAYRWLRSKTGKYWVMEPSCELIPSNGQYDICKTEAEFNAFVAEYMGG
jgi:hypothetical protein